MIKDNKILILNTGGTFSKIYNPLNGTLEINKENIAINEILNNSKIYDIRVEGIIYKDSLEITKKDRKLLVKYIKKSKYEKIILIHGTDTIDKTTLYLSKKIEDKEIVVTGAMIPFSINTVEATSNFMMAYGFLLNNKKNNIYISMHGMVKKYNKIKKNRNLGIFECKK